MFCPKCGSLLKIKGDQSSCTCGYGTKTKGSMKEEIKHKDDTIAEVSEINPFAKEKHVCPKCGFDKAVLIESQIGVRDTWNNSEADRPSYVCGKCGFREFVE